MRACFQRGAAGEIKKHHLSRSQGSCGLTNPNSKLPRHQQVLLYPGLCLRAVKGLVSVRRQLQKASPVCRGETFALREAETQQTLWRTEGNASMGPQGLAFILFLQVVRKTWDLGAGKAKCPVQPPRVSDRLSQASPSYPSGSMKSLRAPCWVALG